jgi:hypothetical protein
MSAFVPGDFSVAKDMDHPLDGRLDPLTVGPSQKASPANLKRMEAVPEKLQRGRTSLGQPNHRVIDWSRQRQIAHAIGEIHLHILQLIGRHRSTGSFDIDQISVGHDHRRVSSVHRHGCASQPGARVQIQHRRMRGDLNMLCQQDRGGVGRFPGEYPRLRDNLHRATAQGYLSLSPQIIG